MATEELVFFFKVRGGPKTLRHFGLEHPELVRRRLGGGSRPGDPVFSLTDTVEFGPYCWTGDWSTFQSFWEDSTKKWPTITITTEVLGSSVAMDSNDLDGITTIVWFRGHDTQWTFTNDPDEIAAFELTLKGHVPWANDYLEESLCEMFQEDDTTALTMEDWEANSRYPRKPFPSNTDTAYEMRIQERQDLHDEDINPTPVEEEPESWERPDEDYDAQAAYNEKRKTNKKNRQLPDDLPF